MFKRFVATGIAACAGLVIGMTSLPAAAAAFTLDIKIGQANLQNSGDAAEEAAIEGIVGQNLTLADKQDINTAQLNEGFTDQWFIDVAPDEPGYFALKFGTGGTGVLADTFFFQNIAELTKLVFSDADILGLGAGCHNCNIGRISHYTTFDGGNHDVPEPLTAALLGIGLLGMGAVRRRR